MTLKQRIRMTASEIAMGRYMRAPDHPGADDFDAAFANLTREEPAAGAADDKGGTIDDKGPGDPPPADGADDKGGEPPAADDKGGEPPAADDKGGEPPAADDKGAAPSKDAPGGDGAGEPPADADDKGGKPGKAAKAPPAAAVETDDDVLKRLAKAVKNVDVEDKPATEETPQETPLFTDEEQAKIEHFKKEWPEVAEAFELQSRAVASSIMKYIFSQVAEQFIPIRDTVAVLAQRTHYGDLKDKVGEYTDDERQDVIDWVGQQPAYLQKAMMSVIEEGTAEEVSDLISRYREATGKQPAGAQDDPPPAPGGDVELSDEAKKAAAALAPVNTKRSVVQAAEDKSDFDGAFSKFADELG